MHSLTSPVDGPTGLMARIEQALDEPGAGDLPHSIARGLAFALAAEDTPERKQQYDRLPLSRARMEARARLVSGVHDFTRHILESWVLAQHTYWSVGRGLADARAGGRMLLRLRIILEEGGWTLTPGAPIGTRPRPTPDRLQTALTLACECGLLVV